MNAPAKPTPERVPVLVVLHPDGFVEVFGPTLVRAVIVNQPATVPREEKAAEEWVERRLPKPFAELRVPSGPTLRATGQFGSFSVGELAEQDALARMVGEIMGGIKDEAKAKNRKKAAVAAGPVPSEV